MARGRLKRPTPRQLAQLVALAATGLAAFNLLVLAAERSMDPGGVGVVVATVPVLLALAGPIQRKRRPEPGLVAAAVLVAAGATAVQGLGGHVTGPGLAAALGALACEAAFSLLAAPLLRPLGPITVSAYAAALATPMLATAAAATTGFAVPTLAQAASLAWLATIVTAVAFTLWYSAVQTLGVERAGLFSGVLPVAALLAAAALGDSRLTPGRAAGATAVALGIAAGLTGLRGARSRPRRRPSGGRPSSSPTA
jgi:drug/metabolite transporter (DMT)-like permease